MCSAHYIREKVVAEMVLESMQRVFWYVQSFEKDFAGKQMAAYGIPSSVGLTAVCLSDDMIE